MVRFLPSGLLGCLAVVFSFWGSRGPDLKSPVLESGRRVVLSPSGVLFSWLAWFDSCHQGGFAVAHLFLGSGGLDTRSPVLLLNSQAHDKRMVRRTKRHSLSGLLRSPNPRARTPPLIEDNSLIGGCRIRYLTIYIFFFFFINSNFILIYFTVLPTDCFFFFFFFSTSIVGPHLAHQTVLIPIAT
jgi:hypothetical protein